MLLQVLTVHDSKAESFIKPFFCLTKATGIRDFAHACNQEDNQFNMHAGDYTLFHLGHYDDESAEFTLFPSPVSLGLALQFIENDIARPHLAVPRNG